MKKDAPKTTIQHTMPASLKAVWPAPGAAVLLQVCHKYQIDPKSLTQRDLYLHDAIRAKRELCYRLSAELQYSSLFIARLTTYSQSFVIDAIKAATQVRAGELLRERQVAR